MLSVKELKTLIKAHNKLSQIKIPPKAKAEDLVKLIESNGYKVDHEKKEIKPVVKRGKKITMKKAEELVPKKKEKTEEDKKKTKDKKRDSIIKYILENKDILKHPEIKKLL
jgi:hypothetical protein